jgi:tRNA nucleotidyltransferase (CCA-adding enzyme)
VRDALLGQTGADRDFVVVGATIDAMLAAGFMPVGRDFPVFLHPVTHDEYALARTERKSGKGYKGFVFNAAPSVTLIDDLSRRDLTINAIAINAQGELIDPFHGIDDLDHGVFRHIGPAFSEDPVRLLRIARFASRWPGFVLAPETRELCRAIVTAGETRALVAERVWQEIQKGLMDQQPSKMLAVLMDCGAWMDLHPAMVAPEPAAVAALDHAARDHAALEVRYALLAFNNGHAQAPDFLRAPKTCTDLAALCRQQSQALACVNTAIDAPGPQSLDVVVNWLLHADVVRKPERFTLLIDTLRLAGRVTPAQAADLQEFADLICSPAATDAVAAAAQAAHRTGAPIAERTRLARRDILHAHPRFRG